MLNFLRREKNRQKAQNVSGSVPQAQLQVRAQGEQEAPIEPYFPTADEAVETNAAAHEAYGGQYQGLRAPNELESAIARAQQHYYYGPEQDDAERLTTAAAKMAYGIGMNQPFVDGNKRTAFWLTRHFLNENDLGHVLPEEADDPELADHLLGHGEGTHSEQDTIDMFLNRLHGQQRTANILDEIYDALDPRVWDDPASPEPTLKQEHSQYIHEKVFSTLEAHGYDGMERWLSLVFTGSLTTYQYGDHSDVDISLFVDVKKFPEWSRAEMIGLMIENTDGTLLPGTPFPLQCFVVPPSVTKQDLYKPGLRSGYDLATDTWIVPPDRNRVHDVESEMNEAYTVALENADKMDRLLRYEPDKAIQFWHQIHERRKRDQAKGRGDYAPSNITYKMLANRGLFPRIEEASGEYLAMTKKADYQGWTNWDTWNTKLMLDNEREHYDAMQQMAERGTTPEEIRDYALRHVVGPHNQDAIADAKEWNSIPEEERVDHHYEDLKDKSPQAADIVDALGMGADVSDSEPTLIDPELVNWNEIHQNMMDEQDENREYENEDARLKGMGLNFAMPGHSDHTNQMLDAWMKHHGIMDEDQKTDKGFSAAHHTLMDVPVEDYSNGENYYGPEKWAEYQRQGHFPRGVREHGWDTLHDILRGTATPNQQQIMNQALVGQGYTPEQIAEITRQRYAVVPSTGERVDLDPKPVAQPDPSLDQPGDLTLPPNWANRR